MRTLTLLFQVSYRIVIILLTYLFACTLLHIGAICIVAEFMPTCSTNGEIFIALLSGVLILLFTLQIWAMAYKVAKNA